MDTELIIIGIVVGLAIGYVYNYACKQEWKERLAEMQKGKENAERELEGAFDTIADYEHELVVKQNVINSLSEKVNRLQNIIKRSKV